MDKESSSQTIYLESDEEITSVIDRLGESDAKEIVLVIPKGTALLKSIINLKLLKKEAEKIQKQVSIVTADRIGKNLATKAGFIVHHEIKEKPTPLLRLRKKNFRPMGFSKNQENKKTKENKSIKISDIIRRDKSSDKVLRIKPIGEKVTDEKQKKRHSGKSSSEEVLKAMPVKTDKKKKTVILLPTLGVRFFLIFFVFCIAITSGVAFLVLPTAEIIIIPKTEPFTLNLDIIVDKNISERDFQTTKIPGKIISIEKESSQEFPATGMKKIQEKAKGVITVYNEWDSSSQILVKTTRFLSKEGKLFRTTKTVTIPGFTRTDGKDVPGSVDIEVVADKPGQDYNIGPTSFTIPGFAGTAKHSLIYGRSKEPMEGGIIGEVKIVSSEDIENARESLTKILKEEAKNQLKKDSPQGLKLLENSFYEEVTGVNTSVESGAQADEFTQFVKVRSSALVFSEEEVRNLVQENLAKNVAQEREILNQTLKIVYGQEQVDFNEGQMRVPVRVEVVAFWEIRTDEIKSQIIGKGEQELKNYLQNQRGIERAKVSFWPFWVKRVPYSAKKIGVTIDTENISDRIE